MQNYSFYRSKPVIPGGWRWLFLVIGLFGYGTLNRGFAYIGWYPIFIGEGLLLFYLLRLNHIRLLPIFLGTSVGKVWSIFFIYNFIVFLLSLQIDLSEAIRNSIYWVYSIFLYVGFVWGRRLFLMSRGVYYFEKMFLFVCLASVMYSLMFPFRETLRDLTSFLYENTALIGYYSTYHVISIPFAFYIFFYAKYNQNPGLIKSMLYYLGITGILTTLILTQARASFLEFIFSIIFILFMSNKILKIISWRFLTAGCLALAIVLSSGASFKGSRGDILTVATSIFFESVGDDALKGTRRHRLEMWENVLRRTTSTLETSIFGLGFSELLIDRATGVDTVLRYPHNSYVSIIGFTGFFGLGLFLLLQVMLIKYAFNQKKTDPRSTLVTWYPFLPLGISVGTFFGTALESPFHSFIYYLLSGIVTGIVYAKMKLLTKGVIK